MPEGSLLAAVAKPQATLSLFGSIGLPLTIVAGVAVVAILVLALRGRRAKKARAAASARQAAAQTVRAELPVARAGGPRTQQLRPTGPQRSLAAADAEQTTVIPRERPAGRRPVPAQEADGWPTSSGAALTAAVTNGATVRNGASVSNGALATNGVPARNVAPTRNGLPATNGAAARNGLPVPSGPAARNGTPTTNGAPVRNGAPTRNGLPATNGAATRNGVPVANGAATRNDVPASNGGTVRNGASNGTSARNLPPRAPRPAAVPQRTALPSVDDREAPPLQDPGWPSEPDWPS